MRAALIKLQPWDRSTSSRVDVYVGDAPSAALLATMGIPWEPAVTKRPEMSLELMSPDLDGQVQVGKARFEIDLKRIRNVANLNSLQWRGAHVTILSNEAQQDLGAAPEFVGDITVPRLSLDTGRLSIEAQVSDKRIDTPLLTAEFDGSAGLGGGASKRGTLKPAGFGSVKNIGVLFFDDVNNVGMIDGYGNTLTIDWLGEGLSSLGPRVADYPNYAALVAAITSHAIPPGRWGSCVAQGLVGLGAPPVGVVTAHATFGSNRPGALMRRWIEQHAGVSPSLVDAAAFASLDAIVDRAVHYWTDAQVTVKELVQTMAASCNATPLITFQNKITVTRALGGATVGTLNRNGQVEPRVLQWQTADSEAPFYQLKARAARPAGVLNRDSVNYVDSFVDTGLYDDTKVYRAGNIASLADKSQWLYTNSTPSAGHAIPSGSGSFPRSDSYWTEQSPPLTATAIGVEEGATRGANMVFNGDATQGLEGWFKDEQIVGTVAFEQSATAEAIGGDKSFRLRKTALAHGANAVARAIPVIPGTDMVFRVRYYGSTARTNGLYVRLNLLASQTAPVGGYVTSGIRTGIIDAIGDGPVAITVSMIEYPFTVPAGVYWVSPAIYNWANGPLSLIFDDISVVKAVDWAKGIGGAGKPEDGATRNTYYVQSTAPAGATDGSLWKDTSTTPAKFKLRNGGAWVDVSSLVTDTGQLSDGAGLGLTAQWASVAGSGKPENNATKNTYFTGASDPGGSDGSLWKDTSTTPARFRLKIAGTWIDVSSLVTDTAQITDGANLGLTAIWSGVVGSGKPQDNADVTLNAQVTVDMVNTKEIAADYTGSVVGALPVTFNPSVVRNGASIRTDNGTQYAVTKVSDGSAGGDGGTVSVDTTNGSATKGQVSVSAMTADIVAFRLTITVAGVVVARIECELKKKLGAPPVGGGTKTASVNANQATNSNSYTPASSNPNPQLTVAAGEQLYAAGTVQYDSSGDTFGTRTGAFKHQYSTDNATWTDFGGALTGSSARPGFYDSGDFYPPITGSANIGQNVSVSPGNYYVRTVFALTTSDTTRFIGLQNNIITYQAKS